MDYINSDQSYERASEIKNSDENNQKYSDSTSQASDESKPIRKKLTPEEKIALLEAKKKKIEAQMKEVEEKVSKNDTRRKILIGAAILAILENPKDDRVTEVDLLDIMNNFLVRDADRKLFDLNPIAK
jgi:hypothetical protein